jgi:hypothetical protein
MAAAGWNVKLEPIYLAVFFGALALSAAAAHLVPPRRRQVFLAAVGLAFMAAFLSPAMAASLVLLSWTVRFVLCPRSSARRVAAAAALALAGGLPLVYGGFFLRYEAGRLSAEDWVRAIFLVDFFKKMIYYIYERGSGRVAVLDGGEYLSYYFALPSMLGLGVVASPAHWRERWQARPSREALSRGLSTLARAGLHLLALGVLMRWSGGWVMLGRRADASMSAWPWTRSWAIFVGDYVGFYLLRYGYEQTFVGSARLLGWDIHDNYEAPLLAPDYAEHWRRWNTHFRDLLLSMFYFPAALALARRLPGRPEWTMAAAGLATFAGSGVFNFITNAVFLPPLAWTSYRLLAEQLVLYEAFQWAMVTAATLARLRRRAAGRPEPGPVRRMLGAGAAVALRGVSLPLLKSRPVGWSLGSWVFKAAI